MKKILSIIIIAIALIEQHVQIRLDRLHGKIRLTIIISL